jgi:hypothetical protein
VPRVVTLRKAKLMRPLIVLNEPWTDAGTKSIGSNQIPTLKNFTPIRDGRTWCVNALKQAIGFGNRAIPTIFAANFSIE